MWVGSQATKPLRVSLALLFAPAAEIMLTAAERRFCLFSRRRAFFLLCSVMLGSTLSICMAVVMYGILCPAAIVSAPASSLISLLSPTGLGQWTPHSYKMFRVGDWEHHGHQSPRYRASVMATGKEDDGGRDVVTNYKYSSTNTVSDGLVEEPMRPYRGGNTFASWKKSKLQEAAVLKRKTKRITPQKAADLYPPAQENIHGWKEQPKYLQGFWSIGDAKPLPPPAERAAPEAIAAAAPAVAAAAVLAAAKTTEVPQSSKGCSEQHREGLTTNHEKTGQAYAMFEGFSDQETGAEEAIDLGEDILHHVNYVVLKKDGSLKAGPASLGVSPRSWRFTPANKRLVFEVDVPGRGITLR